MGKKNRKIKKVVADKPSMSNSIESDSSDKLCNYDENIEGDASKPDKETFNDNISSSIKIHESEISVGLIKIEKLDIETRSNCSSNEEKKSESLSATSDMSNSDASFLFVELKLISIDNKCKNFKKLTQTFLCLNANAHVEHIQKLIFKKMMLSDKFFEVILEIILHNLRHFK